MFTIDASGLTTVARIGSTFALAILIRLFTTTPACTSTQKRRITHCIFCSRALVRHAEIKNNGSRAAVYGDENPQNSNSALVPHLIHCDQFSVSANSKTMEIKPRKVIALIEFSQTSSVMVGANSTIMQPAM